MRLFMYLKIVLCLLYIKKEAKIIMNIKLKIMKKSNNWGGEGN